MVNYLFIWDSSSSSSSPNLNISLLSSIWFSWYFKSFAYCQQLDHLFIKESQKKSKFCSDFWPKFWYFEFLTRFMWPRIECSKLYWAAHKLRPTHPGSRAEAWVFKGSILIFIIISQIVSKFFLLTKYFWCKYFYLFK